MRQDGYILVDHAYFFKNKMFFFARACRTLATYFWFLSSVDLINYFIGLKFHYFAQKIQFYCQQMKVMTATFPNLNSDLDMNAQKSGHRHRLGRSGHIGFGFGTPTWVSVLCILLKTKYAQN